MNLVHYYERGRVPFLSLSDLSDNEALMIHNSLETKGSLFAKRNQDGLYMHYRRIVEGKLYSKFIEKGGKPCRKTPYYMVLGECSWLKLWYINPESISIPIEEFDKETLSFTYGDSFPTFDPTTGETQEYRQNIYLYDEIWDIIEKYGMPLEHERSDDVPYWNVEYIEVQIWSDDVINRYRV